MNTPVVTLKTNHPLNTTTALLLPAQNTHTSTALLLPAQNTHTLHDPKRDTEHARAGGVEDGLSVGGLDGGGDVGDVVCEEAAGGRAALAVSRVVGGCVNVNTTDATAGATALLLPAQNTHINMNVNTTDATIGAAVEYGTVC